MVEHIDVLIQITRAKAALCRIFFARFILKFYGRFTPLGNGYAGDKLNMILDFIRECERAYDVREYKLEKLKEDIKKNTKEKIENPMAIIR